MDRRNFLKNSAALAAVTVMPAVSSCGSECKNAVKDRQVRFSRAVDVKYDVDVFVAGGGPAGCAAAVCAAEHGAKVFLAEAHSCFGGLGTAGRVPVFMQWTDGVNFLADGFGRRIRDRLEKERRIPKVGNNGANDLEAFKRTYDAMMEEAGVQFSFMTKLADVVTSGKEGDRTIDFVLCAAPSGMFAVKAKVYVDCTGNGDLSAWAGAPCELGDETGHVMPSTLCSLWGGIDWDRWNREKPDIPFPDGYMLEEAFKAGVFTEEDRHHTGISPLEGGFGGANISHVFEINGTDEVSVTRGLVFNRKKLVEYENYYRNFVKRGFENARMLASAELLGIRESRRVIGDYVFNIEDYMNRAVFEDEIGRYAYPVDIHPSKTDEESYRKFREDIDRKYKYKPGENYGIPYRALTPKGVSNLLVAGRCISTDQKVQASVRVMPGCYITGQAAGVAAAICAADNVSTHKVDVRKVQKALVDCGAYLPNFKA